MRLVLEDGCAITMAPLLFDDPDRSVETIVVIFSVSKLDLKHLMEIALSHQILDK